MLVSMVICLACGVLVGWLLMTIAKRFGLWSGREDDLGGGCFFAIGMAGVMVAWAAWGEAYFDQPIRLDRPLIVFVRDR